MSAHSWYSCMRLANSLAATRVYAASRDSAFLIVNGGTHAERESGARAGPTPLWGKRSGMVFRTHILPEPYYRYTYCL